MECKYCGNALTRRKTLSSDMFTTPLDRCLTTFDLTILGLAQMVGAGIFVLTGTVTNAIAGPAVIISFFIAGVAAILSALCYAEFGSLIPRTGSAYLFTYTVLGEGLGFMVGWCLLAEQIFGAATVSRSLSGMVDSLFGLAIQNWTLEAFGPISLPGLSSYPDFLAIAPIIITATFAISGAKVTARMNNILTVIHLSVLCFIIVLGYIYADFNNWLNEDAGGFFPYGLGGALSGAATCFFAFVGFGSIALAGEEAKNPRRSVPLALLISMPIVCLLYVLASGALTLLQPFYEIDILAPFPVAFDSIGLPWAKYIVNIGIIIALFTTLIATQYAMPRVIYAMASDGLLFRWMGDINSRTKTPINAILSLSVPIILLAVFIDMEVLVELYSVGTLLSFLFVAISLMKLHYEVPETNSLLKRYTNENEDSKLLMDAPRSHNVGKLRVSALKLPLVAKLSSLLSTNQLIFAMVTCQSLFGIAVSVGYHRVGFDVWGLWLSWIILGLLALFFFILLSLHQTNSYSAGFRLPLSPLLETMSISINLLLMFLLQPLTWARLAVWLLPGAVLYLTYGMRYSTERNLSDKPYNDDHLVPDSSPVETSEDTKEVAHTGEQPANYGTI